MTGFTKGPWRVFIDDSGGKWSGWPISINAEEIHQDCMIVRTGGQWPYEWDFAISQREAVANANLIAAAPDMYEALEWLETYAMIQVDRHPDAEDNKGWRNVIAALSKARGEET